MRWYAATCAAAIVFGSAALASPACAELAGDHAVGQSDNAQNITVIVANGLGTTIESAVQNAAANALTQVVGSFVDVDKQIERRTQITDGIHAETRNISNKMREYSQGSIKSFDVLDTQQDGGIVRIVAKVEVKIDILHAQLEGALAGSTAVSKGLFAQAATEQTQQVNAEAIFIERIITPLVQGAGLSLTVGDPAKMDNAQLACRPRNYGMCDDTYSLWLQRQHADNVYRIPVTLTADPGTSEAVWQTASSISKEPCVRLDLNAPQPFEPIEQAIRNFRRTPIDDGHKRYVAVLHRIGKSSSGSACYLSPRRHKKF